MFCRESSKPASSLLLSSVYLQKEKDAKLTFFGYDVGRKGKGCSLKRVLMDISADLTRIALAEDGELKELYYESKREESLVGNVYAGRVASVMPNLQAAFVDIGTGRNGYYYYGNARAVSDAEKNAARPKVGDTLLLQVEKDAVGTKGAVLTGNFSFPGKFLVLLPKEGGEIGISRKITDSAERVRIREILTELLPPDCGAIVRTNGEGKSREEFEKEWKQLWVRCERLKTGEFLKPPALLLQENHPVKRAARDFYGADVEEYVVNDAESYRELLESGDFNGEGQPALKLHTDAIPLFESYYLESQGAKALEERVWLKSGGFLVIEETEACVVIDVNTGKAAGRGDLQKTILKTNLEAAEEAAKQMRLRNLSGIIIIDFIDMADAAAQKEVTQRLKKAVAQDRIKTVVVGMTELGLMQVTRKKTRPSLKRQMTTKCRACEGSGRLPSVEWTVTKMRREAQSVFAHTIYNRLIVRAEQPLLAAFAGSAGEWARLLEEKTGGTLRLEEAPLGFGRYEMRYEKQYEEKENKSDFS